LIPSRGAKVGVGKNRFGKKGSPNEETKCQKEKKVTLDSKKKKEGSARPLHQSKKDFTEEPSSTGGSLASKGAYCACRRNIKSKRGEKEGRIKKGMRTGSPQKGEKQ